MYLLLSLLMFIDPVGPKVITPVKGVTRPHWTPGDYIFAGVLIVLAIVIVVALFYVVIRKLRAGAVEPLIQPPVTVQPASIFTPRKPTYKTPMDDIIAADLQRIDELDKLEAEKRRWAERNNFRPEESPKETKA